MITLRQHVGCMISSFFGPNKSYKVIVDGKEHHLCRCPLLYIQKIHLKDPLICLLEETLFAHHEQYGCSTMSLLTMWYLWDEELQKLIEEGCEIKDITKNALVCLESVITSLPKISLKIDEVLFPKIKKNSCGHSEKVIVDPKMYSKSCKLPFKIMPGVIDKNSTVTAVGLNYSSRHFSPFKQPEMEDKIKANPLTCVQFLDDKDCLPEEVLDKFLNTVKSLSHGNDESAGLIHKIWCKQAVVTKDLKFKIEEIIICPRTAPSLYSTIVQGLLIKSNFYTLCDQDFKKIESYKALIIKGSILLDYVHLGFSPKISTITKKSAQRMEVSQKEIWVKKCCSLMSKLCVNVLFVKGDVDPEVSSFCYSNSIIVFSNIPEQTMKIFYKSLNADACTYLLDCDEKNVASNFSMKKWKFPPKDRSDDYLLIEIQGSQLNIFTVVLCHPSPQMLSSLEHQFWHLAYRLNLATTEGNLLPGGGKSEEWASHNLSENTLNEKIAAAVARGFLSCSKLIHDQERNFETQDVDIHLDELQSKINAWHSAMTLVLLTLQCDFLLVNDYENVKINKMFEEPVECL